MSDPCADRGLFVALRTGQRLPGVPAPTRDEKAVAAMVARVVRACEDLRSVVIALAD